uniref:Large ribosomal subunit protein eL13 n=1 Tax=Ursus maritimus TaxID=29073 RepID=A0A452TX38_URSMA
MQPGWNGMILRPHLHKDCQWHVATWFNQRARNICRRNAPTSQGRHHDPAPCVQTARAHREEPHS